MLKRTTALEKILQLRSRYKVVQGGTSAGKTFSICMMLIDYAESTPDKVISITSETFPQLRKGAMRDFLNILKMTNRYSEAEHNKTDNEYNFANGTKVEFFSADSEQKVRGPRRDILFLNEANNVDYETFTQLEIRTRQSIWVDFNPTNAFWAHEKVINREDAEFIKLTYKDNEALEPAIVKAIEAKEHDNPNWWRVYGLGEIGHYEGQIYENFDLVDQIPKNAKFLGIGLDFGYTDPTAAVNIYEHNKEYYLRQRVYASNLTNKEIAELLPDEVLIVADSAEPKSIDEIRNLGKYITPAQKGKDSVKYGIQLLQGVKLHITKESTDVIKDFRGYSWKKDRSGKSLPIPAHEFSHSPDAVRYFLADYLEGQSNQYDQSDFIII